MRLRAGSASAAVTRVEVRALSLAKVGRAAPSVSTVARWSISRESTVQQGTGTPVGVIAPGDFTSYLEWSDEGSAMFWRYMAGLVIILAAWSAP